MPGQVGPDAAEAPEAAAPIPPGLLELQRMEASLVRASLDHPDALEPAALRRLRYLLGFARLDTFQPGAAERRARTDRPELSVGPEVEPLRSRVVAELTGVLLQERNRRERLRRAAPLLDRLAPALEETRRHLLERHGDRCSQPELDAEAGRRVLVNVAGGGGGAGFVYIGAYQRLEEAGIVPAYVIGSSIGALLGLFRARAVPGPWDEYVDLARGLDRQSLLVPLRIRRRHGLPGLLFLNLADAVGPAFRHPDGSPVRIRELQIPYEAVVAGVRTRAFRQLPQRFRRPPDLRSLARFVPRMPGGPLAPAVASRMWQVALFFDPRVAKPIILGADEDTAGLPALDAAGFSTAIPGVLHYEAGDDDPAVAAQLRALLEREAVAALVDGGVVANVPAELAWRRVHEGKLGTRNALYLAFDCFSPRWDPTHLWLQPITQAVQLQMTRNAQFADWVLRFERALSPVELVPSQAQLDDAIGWGRAAIEERLPMIERFLEPVAWDG